MTTAKALDERRSALTRLRRMAKPYLTTWLETDEIQDAERSAVEAADAAFETHVRGRLKLPPKGDQPN